MRITDLLKKDGIALGVDVADKNAAIEMLVSLHENAVILLTQKPIRKAF